MAHALVIDDAHKRFGATDALQGAAFHVEPGEWLALLGPNGAGKTTSVRAVAGRVELDRGRIELLGTTLTARSDRDARRRLGVVPQEIALYPNLTARENLAAWAALRGITGRKRGERIDWALEWTALGDRAGDRVGTFSGGMKRRLNIAASVLHRPDVVLLDEPTVGVDPQSRQRIWDMLDALRRDGTALVLTTHQLDEAQQVCDRIVIIDHGRTIADGTFEDLVRSTVGPERRIVFALADAAPAALLEAGFEATADRTVTCSVRDIATELPRHLEALATAGAEVQDMRIEAPSLQAVFIHLTGRELRE